MDVFNQRMQKRMCSSRARSPLQALQMVIAIVLGSYGAHQPPAIAAPPAIAQASTAADAVSSCRPAALSQLLSHTVTSGETLESVATVYGLLPVTVMGMNPALSSNQLTPGTTLRIPPFNGIEIRVPAAASWQDLASTYQVRADILFEVNGCTNDVPERIFIPGVNWFPGVEDAISSPQPEADTDSLTGYPLSNQAEILSGYGWQTHPERDELVFSSGILLQADPGDRVLTPGDGTVAFVGEDDVLGPLIVINHAQGLQTRYAWIESSVVQVGDRVKAGQTIAAVMPNADNTAVLYFEVRSNSDLGWVARNPGDYIPDLAVR